MEHEPSEQRPITQAYLQGWFSSSVLSVGARSALSTCGPTTAYNEEQFYVSYGDYRNPGVTQRVMNYLCFLNSKTLFRYVRE
eukprot:361548-Prorocentrum_minimum.AAC.1